MRSFARVGLIVLTACAPFSGATAQESAGSQTDPVVQIKPLIDARIRFESIDQDSMTADAVTLRVRAGAEIRRGPLSLLAEGEATTPLVDRYRQFPFDAPASPLSQAGLAVIPDPENAELNRLQVQYRFAHGEVTAGRQRINLDDQRWVGSVGWRQNEQTFDAVRGTLTIGPASADLIYSGSQRTIFGTDAGRRTANDGEFILAGLSAAKGVAEGKVFAYLIDYEESYIVANSSQTYGGWIRATVPFSPGRSVSARASYARQSDLGNSPHDYSADYWAVDLSTSAGGFDVAAGLERLESDGGHAVQTPMATLHKFNGWADMFLTTPASGLQDAYLTVGRRFRLGSDRQSANAIVALHDFRSTAGSIAYGREIDASFGFTLRKAEVLFKYAWYEARGFGSDTAKLWLQLETKF